MTLITLMTLIHTNDTSHTDTELWCMCCVYSGYILYSETIHILRVFVYIFVSVSIHIHAIKYTYQHIHYAIHII